MRDSSVNQDDLYFDEPEEPSGVAMAFVLAVVLFVMVVAFVWFVVRFDPLTSDFIEGDSPVATATENPEGT